VVALRQAIEPELEGRLLGRGHHLVVHEDLDAFDPNGRLLPDPQSHARRAMPTSR
jgi:hypothetical protein